MLTSFSNEREFETNEYDYRTSQKIKNKIKNYQKYLLYFKTLIFTSSTGKSDLEE